ncbi:MAG: PQQ-dependent sugar dehydrogenase, partial [Rhizobiaceae bacterium]
MRKLAGFFLLFLLSETQNIVLVFASDTHKTELGIVRVDKIADGFDTPWAMSMLPDGRLLVTERDGKLILIDSKNPRNKVNVSGLPRIKPLGQGGLLDVVL